MVKVATGSITLTNINDGRDGTSGSAGVGIQNTKYFYQLSNDGEQPPIYGTPAYKGESFMTLVEDDIYKKSYPTNRYGNMPLYQVRIPSTNTATYADTWSGTIRNDSEYVTINFWIHNRPGVATSAYFYLPNNATEAWLDGVKTNVTNADGGIRFNNSNAEWTNHTITWRQPGFTPSETKRIIVGRTFKDSTQELQTTVTRPTIYRGKVDNPDPNVVNIEEYGWSTSPDLVTSDNKYLWAFRQEIMTDGTSRIYPPTVIAVHGEKGAQGTPGTNGKSSHTHIRYANLKKDPAYTSYNAGAYQGSVFTKRQDGDITIYTSTTDGTNPYKILNNFNGTVKGGRAWLWIDIENVHPTEDLRISFNGVGDVLNKTYPTINVKPGERFKMLKESYCRDTYDFIQINMAATPANSYVKYKVYQLDLLKEYPWVDFSDVSAGREYMGIYSDDNDTTSSDPGDYKWSRVKGDPTYTFTAYANKDGNGWKDFSFLSTTQRYLGIYHSFNPVQSTNPNDYEWTDMAATVEVGVRNYFKGYRENEEVVLSTYQNVGSFIQIYDKITYPLPEADGKNFTISFEAISPNGDTVIHCYNSNDNPRYFYFRSDNVGTVTNKWKKFKITVNPVTKTTYTASTNSNLIEFYAPSKTGVKIRNIKIEVGTVATNWSQAPEDAQDEINSKADQIQTEAQLEELRQANAAMQAELDAKLAMDTFVDWMQDIMDKEQANKEETENKLQLAMNRLVGLEKNLQEASAKLNFVDIFMTFSDEGMTIGRKDGSTSLFLQDDRISLMSSGREVMSISQGMIHIDNGIFTMTLQIGKYRFEQPPNNPDHLLVRYMGG